MTVSAGVSPGGVIVSPRGVTGKVGNPPGPHLLNLVCWRRYLLVHFEGLMEMSHPGVEDGGQSPDGGATGTATGNPLCSCPGPNSGIPGGCR